MSHPALIYQRSARPSSLGSAPLSASRCLIASRFAMLVPGVFTTRATTPGAGSSRQSGPNGTGSAMACELDCMVAGLASGISLRYPGGLRSGGGGMATGLVIDATGFEVLVGDD